MSDDKAPQARGSEQIDRYESAAESEWQITWRQFRKNRVGVLGLTVVYLLFAVAVFAPLTANGLPYYLRGVVTVFFDSDVTAWRELHKELGLGRAQLAGSGLAAGARAATEGRVTRTRRQLEAVLDRFEDVLPDSELPAFAERRDRYRALLSAPHDEAAAETLGKDLDGQLSVLTYALCYRRSANAIIDIEQDGLAVMRAAQEEYGYALEDEDEELAAEERAKYGAGYAVVKARQASLKELYAAMADFLTPTLGEELRAAGERVSASLEQLPEAAPEDGGTLEDPLDEFSVASALIDRRFARMAVDPSRQRLPSRRFWPVFRYLHWGEVFFLALYLFTTGLLVAARRGLRLSGRAVLLYVLLPTLLCAASWRGLVPPRNPPPDSYYKRFASELQDRLDRGDAVSGRVLFSPVPFGENENISKDAKRPPTWSETSESLRRRLATAVERAAEFALLSPVGAWRASGDEGLERSRLSLGGEAGAARVAVFPLVKGRYAGSFAPTIAAWKTAWAGARVGAAPRALSARGALGEGALRYLDGAGPLRALMVLEDPSSRGNTDTVTWGVEVEDPKSDPVRWLAEVEQMLNGAQSSLDERVLARLERPVHRHWLGTDENGRDVLARMIYGSRVSLSVGFIAVFIYVFIGIVVGALAGFFGGWTDIAISRFIEVVICFPSFFLIITVLAMWPPSIVNIMIVIGITRWTGVARLIRGEFLRLVNLDFVVACRALGFSPLRVIFRHIVPNALAPVLVAATFGVAGAILTESALSYLGFGVPQPQASWGSILQEASSDPKQLWWITVFPGLAIFVTITAYNIVGESFRDAADPRLRK